MFTAHRFPYSLPKERVSENIGESPILGQTLAEWQDWAVLLSKGQWSDTLEQANLLIREDVFLSQKALELFIGMAKATERSVYWRAKGRVGDFVAEISFADTTPMLIWWNEETEFHPSALETYRADGILEQLEIEVKMNLVNVPVPKSQFGVDLIQLPLSDFIVVPTGHWAQLLWANLLSMGTFLWRELVGSNPLTAIPKLLWAVLRVFSIEPGRLASVLKKKGSNCTIHPTAVVEASVLGDDVVIGAHAVVRGCMIGNGVRIEDLAMVEFSVISDDAVVQRQAMVKFSVLDQRSAVGGVVQLGVLSRSATIKRGAYLMDMNFAGGAKIAWNGQIRQAPLGLVGCCVGEESTIGLGVQVAAGRWIPKNRQIVSDPNQMLQRVTGDEEGLYQVVAGGLKKL